MAKCYTDNERMVKSLVEFIVAPFRFIAEMWRDGPGGQWIVVTIVPVIIFTIWIGGFIATNQWRDTVVEGTVTTGVVVDKWLEPAHARWVGKVWINVPPRCHVVIRGENWWGDERDRDVIVTAVDFEEIEIGSTLSFK